jgi:hypothetical protein
MKKAIAILLLLAIPFMQGCLATLLSAGVAYGLYELTNDD